MNSIPSTSVNVVFAVLASLLLLAIALVALLTFTACYWRRKAYRNLEVYAIKGKRASNDDVKTESSNVVLTVDESNGEVESAATNKGSQEPYMSTVTKQQLHQQFPHQQNQQHQHQYQQHEQHQQHKIQQQYQQQQQELVYASPADAIVKSFPEKVKKMKSNNANRQGLIRMEATNPKFSSNSTESEYDLPINAISLWNKPAAAGTPRTIAAMYDDVIVMPSGTVAIVTDKNKHTETSPC